MNRFTFILFSLIFANVAHSASLAQTFKIDTIPFLDVFLHTSVDICDIHYRNYFSNYMNIDIKTRGSFAAIVEYLLAFRPEDFKTKLLQNTSNSSMKKAFANIIENRKRDFRGSHDAANEQLRDIVRDYLIIEMLQKGSTQPKPLDQSILAEVVLDAHKADQNAFKLVQGGHDSLIKHLGAVVQREMTSVSDNIRYWLEFKTMPSASIEKMLTQLVTEIKSSPKKTKKVNENETIETIIELLKAHVAIHSGLLSDKYEFVAILGNMIGQEVVSKNFGNTFLVKLIDRVIGLFADANLVSSWRVGKQLLVSLLVSKIFDPPTPEYRRFLLTKYSIEGLKKEFSRFDYPFMLHCYHLDLLNAFADSETEIFEPTDLKFLFSNFISLTKKYNQNRLRLFHSLRGLLVKSGADLDAFYSLFNSLYNTVLHATEIHDFEPVNLDPVVIFDKYLDSSLQHLNSFKVYFYSGQPDSKFFATDILSRYFFFKFVNLIYNLEQFSSLGVRFDPFVYSNDVLLHKYTLKPENKDFIDYLRTAVLKETFNYKVFSDKEISRQVIKGFLEQKRSLEDMEAKIIFE